MSSPTHPQGTKGEASGHPGIGDPSTQRDHQDVRRRGDRFAPLATARHVGPRPYRSSREPLLRGAADPSQGERERRGVDACWPLHLADRDGWGVVAGLLGRVDSSARRVYVKRSALMPRAATSVGSRRSIKCFDWSGRSRNRRWLSRVTGFGSGRRPLWSLAAAIRIRSFDPSGRSVMIGTGRTRAGGPRDRPPGPGATPPRASSASVAAPQPAAGPPTRAEAKRSLRHD